MDRDKVLAISRQAHLKNDVLDREMVSNMLYSYIIECGHKSAKEAQDLLALLLVSFELYKQALFIALEHYEKQFNIVKLLNNEGRIILIY